MKCSNVMLGHFAFMAQTHHGTHINTFRNIRDSPLPYVITQQPNGLVFTQKSRKYFSFSTFITF